MKSIKMRGICAAVTGALLFGFGANAMADATTDAVKGLVDGGMLTPEAADVVNRGHDKDVAAVKAAPKSIDFMNDDAPFKTNFSIGDHKGDFQFYGIVDIGAVTTNHSYQTNSQLPNQFYPFQAYGSSAGSQSGWNQGGLQDSRFGFKGGIDLFHAGDNNVKLIYQLEGGFDPLNGTLNDAAKTLSKNPKGTTLAGLTTSADSSLNGELFARQAWGGIDAGNLGKLTVGIQYNPFYNIFSAYDPTNKADTFSPLGESGTIGGGGGVSEDARMKNSIKYANGLDVAGGKLTGSAIYQFGNASGDMSKGYGLGLQAGYETDMFGVQVAYDKFEDAIAASTTTTTGVTSNLNGNTIDTYGNAGQISYTIYNTEATLVALKFTPNKEWKFKGGWEWFERQAPTDSNLNYGSLWGYQTYSSVAWSAGKKQAYNVLFAGAEYNFGERFPKLNGLNLAVGYYDEIVEGLVTPGSANGAVGTVNTWTAVLDYTLNKRFDVYAAATNNYFSGAAYKGTGYAQNQDAFGLGVRMKF
jgi:predicted porin